MIALIYNGVVFGWNGLGKFEESVEKIQVYIMNLWKMCNCIKQIQVVMQTYIVVVDRPSCLLNIPNLLQFIRTIIYEFPVNAPVKKQQHFVPTPRIQGCSSQETKNKI